VENSREIWGEYPILGGLLPDQLIAEIPMRKAQLLENLVKNSSARTGILPLSSALEPPLTPDWAGRWPQIELLVKTSSS
jgi:hypothetical protein